MSLPSFPDRETTPSREEAINQILYSIAMEEMGLSCVINAEGEKLQYAIGTIPGIPGPLEPPSIEDLLALNKSVRDTLDSILQNQIFLKSKMQGVIEVHKKCCPFLSSYIEALGNTQTVETNSNIVFDPESIDSVGNNIELSDSGEVFTINRTGLYMVEWNVNISRETPEDATVVIGIIENDEGASGSACSAPGNFASGTLLEVDSVPFTVSLYNYGSTITLENPEQWLDSAISIRIVRFADGPSR